MNTLYDISTGRAVSVKFNKTLKQETLVVSNKQETVEIPINEIDIEKEWTSLSGFLKRTISYTVIDEIDSIKIASRKKVQELTREYTLEKLKSGEVMQARVINLLKYGAYLEIDGVLTVLLKNSDFSNGFITVKEVLRKGESIKVKIKNSNQQSKILVESSEKFEPNIENFFDSLTIDTVIPGTIKTVRPDMCFVNLHPGVDGLANIPFHIDVDEGMKVDFEIKKVDKENKKVRGKILSIKY